MIRALLLVLWLACHGAPPAVEPDPVGAQLFPPELVLDRRHRLGLSAEQVAQIRQEITYAQQEVGARRVELEHARARLVEAVAEEQVEEARALALAEAVMALEAEVKRTHLVLVVRIKNVLTPEQQRLLRAPEP